jgi:hypothetical protein
MVLLQYVIVAKQLNGQDESRTVDYVKIQFRSSSFKKWNKNYFFANFRQTW